jgi:predicted RNase H-like HicB family nuclease
MYYPVAIEEGDETHSYGVVVPDLPGCFSAGESFEEAMESVKEAIAFHLEGLVEDGESIPLASTIEKHRHNPDFADYNFVWALAEVDIIRYLGKAEKVNVTLPSRLIRLIDDRVLHDSRFKSRSAFLAAGAEKLLNHTGA